MSKTLAVKYRPSDWESVCGQSSTKIILQQQLESNTIRSAYAFVGASGCGKTTCARIFANEINKGQGVPIEMDAASHNGVDDAREIIKMAQTKSLDSEYKVFIIDEVHMFSIGAWNAMLKLIEEPPAKSIFIFCTTNPEKIPKTILNRVQRYDFKRISVDEIIDRLEIICENEGIKSDDEVLEFLARQAKGGMRDAISLLDKCLAYSEELTMKNVLEALELPDTDSFMKLTYGVLDSSKSDIIDVIESVFERGVDLKQFVKQYMYFLVDVLKYSISGVKYTGLPDTKEIKEFVKATTDADFDNMLELLNEVISIDSDIKWSQSPKELIEAKLLTF